LDQIARLRVAGDIIDERLPLLIGEAIRSGADKGGSFEDGDGLHGGQCDPMGHICQAQAVAQWATFGAPMKPCFADERDRIDLLTVLHIKETITLTPFPPGAHGTLKRVRCSINHSDPFSSLREEGLVTLTPFPCLMFVCRTFICVICSSTPQFTKLPD
jgi:hypothetical protein